VSSNHKAKTPKLEATDAVSQYIGPVKAHGTTAAAGIDHQAQAVLDALFARATEGLTYDEQNPESAQSKFVCAAWAWHGVCFIHSYEHLH
jgi:hypothetical protein